MLILAVIAGCGGPATTATAPTAPPPTQAPADTAAPPPTTPPTQPPTVGPTEAPTEAPTATTPTASVSFRWDPAAVAPSDADDVAVILVELKNHAGILGGTGNEISINISYDPTVITVEEIMEIFRSIGHPVLRNE